jgi:hypothetical protein
MQVGWLARSPDGAMVGDYVATIFSLHRPVATFPAALAPAGAALNQSLYASSPGALTLQGATHRASASRAASTVSADRPKRPGP